MSIFKKSEQARLSKFSNALYFFITAAFIANTAYGQIEVNGNISDKKSVAVDMATVVLKDSKDNFVTGCVSDSSGCFRFSGLKPGTYNLQISRIGYKDYTSQLDAYKDISVNVILDSVAITIDEVVVTARTPIIRREIDRVVLDAEKLNTVATNFMDVLKHTPGVLVQDDGISMLNKGKIIFLMNGREMNMDMKGLVAYLSSLSADNLKQIEVMTTPPAKYSSEGSAGVINIVTKRLKNNYLGGNVSNQLSVRKSLYDDVNLGLQYKRDKVEAYLNTGVGFGTMQTDSKRSIAYPSETWNTTFQKQKSNNYIITTAGMDYLCTKNSSMGAIFSYTNMQPDVENTAKTTALHAETNLQLKNFETTTDSHTNYNRYNANLHYTLADMVKGGVLNVNADYLNYTINDVVNLYTLHDEDLNYKSCPENSIEVYQAKADMEIPIRQGAISYGVAYSQSKTDNQTHYEWMSTEADLDDHFIYRENILAAYADFRYKCSEYWDFKLGVRGEYGRLDGNSIKMSQRTVKRQFDIFPTAYINYKLGEDKILYFSTSSRINRPSYVDINPFTTYEDAYTVTKGNPNLLPEKSYTAEFGYTQGDFDVSASAMWKNREISSYVSIDDGQKLTTITSDNIMKKQLYSLDVSYYFDKLSWLDCNIDGSFYTIISRPMAGYDLAKTDNTSVFLYINNNIYFNQKRTLMATLWGQYQSKEKDIVGESLSRYRVDLGLKYLLSDKRLALGIECQNMLASHAKSIINYQDITYVFDSNPYRVFKLSLSYRFGKKVTIKQKKFGINNERL